MTPKGKQDDYINSILSTGVYFNAYLVQPLHTSKEKRRISNADLHISILSFERNIIWVRTCIVLRQKWKGHHKRGLTFFNEEAFLKSTFAFTLRITFATNLPISTFNHEQSIRMLGFQIFDLLFQWS